MSRQQIILFGALALLVVVVFFLVISSIPKPAASTPLGVIKIELDPDKAPITVKNFLQYVDDKHYDGTIFHRVLSDFMIQGGGYTQMLTEKRTRTGIENEAKKSGLRNERGTIAMARTGEPHSATAQFYINVVDNKFKLDPAFSDGHGYCVFGKVIDGMDIVDRIRASNIISKPPMFEALPVNDIIIKTARRDATRPEGSPPVVILEIEQSPTRRS
jgi:cyclophilin family peptidyl-prolyl cis-trans isomerase